MATTLEAEFELESMGELEGEYEWESEWESGFSGESESEQFLDALKALAGRAAGAARSGYQWVSKPDSPQRALALKAAHTAVEKGLPALGTLLGARLGSPGAGGAIGGVVGDWLGGYIPQKEFEGEFGEISPVRKIYADALMEHLGHAAAYAETEAEAEALAGALVPLAARSVPAAAGTIIRATPGLVCGVSGVVKTLRANPKTRPLIRTVPGIVRGTAVNIARQAAQGRPVSPQAAVKTLGRETARVLASPQRAMATFKRSNALDRQFHKASGGRCPTCRCGTRA